MNTIDWFWAKYAFNLKIKSALKLAKIEILGEFGGNLIFRLLFSQKIQYTDSRDGQQCISAFILSF
jgi:hypothetical protein